MADENKPVHPRIVVENVSLEELERACYSRDHERASVLLLAALRRLKQGAEFIGYSVDPRVKGVLYTRFCAAVVSLLSDPTFNVSQDGFENFAAEHAITDMMFRASAFETSDHLLAQMASNPSETDRTKLKLGDGAALAKFLLTYSLRSGFALNFEETFKRGPQMTFALWAGMLSPLLTTAVQAQGRRELLLGLHNIFEGIKVSPAAMPTLSDAYMYSSYGVRPDKHDMKATVHALMAKAITEGGAKLPTPYELEQRRNRDMTTGDGKPTMLVCLEWFTSLHAMFRCYAPVIRQLRSRFRLVGMCRSIDADDVGRAEFDEFVEVPLVDISMPALVDTINKIAPDVVYYPSVGMAMWWVAMASVRLAPVQVMSLGHPASSRSPAMDYVLAEDGCIGDPSLFTETIIGYPTGSARFVMRPDAEVPVSGWVYDPETLHVAVPAMLCKLNANFMSALREVSEKSKRPVVFHMFVNMMGVNLYQAAKEIRDWLPTAKVYERTSYNQYLGHIAGCHLHLCTFPFGGTNSNIDSMLLGIPVMALEGMEPHERFDAMMVRRAQLPECLVAKSRDEYVATAVRLLDDDLERNRLHDHLLGFDLHKEFFGEPPEDQRESFADAMWEAYRRGGR